MIDFVNDPLPIICEIARELKPDIDCQVQYHPGIDGAGCTTFPDEPTERILIDINADIPMIDVAEILAHELAHVIVGVTDEDGHSVEWDQVFNEIWRRYDARIAKVGDAHG